LPRHLIGLLLGTEDDWPTAFDEILRRLGPVDGQHAFDCERITIEPFSLRDRPATSWSSTGSPTGTTTRGNG